MAPPRSTCCFCIEFRTGCLIIGYLNLIANIIYILMSIMILVAGALVAAKATEKDAQSAGIVITFVAAILLVFSPLFLSFTIVLLVGVHKHKLGHVKAFVVYSFIFLVLSIILIIVNLSTRQQDASSVIFQILYVLLNIYFWWVIFSYMKQMNNPSKRPAIYNTA